MSNKIRQHQIPEGSGLYFGKMAKQKRDLECRVSQFFIDLGFEEIVTPSFSYSQHQSLDDENDLIIINDKENNQVALRADITIDVVRIVMKRLGRTTDHKKWFYIQPTFTYPSNEIFQIGCEWIGHENISDIMNLTADALGVLNLEPTFQISNINIPKIISENNSIDLNLFKNSEVSALLELEIPWLSNLINVERIGDLDKIENEIPSYLKTEIEKLKLVASDLNYKNIVVSPLYYSVMRYYDDIFYKVIDGNLDIACGGRYKSDNISSLGFALYTDNVLKMLKKQ